MMISSDRDDRDRGTSCDDDGDGDGAANCDGDLAVICAGSPRMSAMVG